MAKALPVEILDLIRRGVADEERFFRLLSAHNNYVDPETVKVFYNGLVDLIKQELRENGGIRLPELMDIALVNEKPHLNLVRAGKIPPMMTMTKILKVFPKEALKSYFREKEKKIQVGYVPGTTLDEYGVGE
jgi:hypothetical protein